MREWIKSPLAILAQGAEGGVVVDHGVIVELVPSGGRPSAPVDATFDASRHVVLPGLVNTHHHMFQTMTRAHPQAINKELVPWLQALMPIWSRHVNPHNFRLATRLALTELGPPAPGARAVDFSADFAALARASASLDEAVASRATALAARAYKFA